jgi:hypothetical protein
LFSFLRSLPIPSWSAHDHIRILYPGKNQSEPAIRSEAQRILDYFSDKVSYGSRAKGQAMIYLALTPFEKKLPSPGSTFNESNINTGFTVFPSKSILVYRFQEWPKVLFHELFHWAGCEVNVDVDRPIPIVYESGNRQVVMENHGWTESLVEWNASMLYQEFRNGAPFPRADVTPSWQESYAQGATKHLQSLLSTLLSTKGPEKDEFGPEYLFLKYWFWSGYSGEKWEGCVSQLRTQPIHSLSSLLTMVNQANLTSISTKTLGIPESTPTPSKWILEWKESSSSVPIKEGGKRRRNKPMREKSRRWSCGPIHRNQSRRRKRSYLGRISMLIRRK